MFVTTPFLPPGILFLGSLFVCFVLALVLRATSTTARRMGDKSFAVGSLWFLWTFSVGAAISAGLLGTVAAHIGGPIIGMVFFGVAFFVGVCVTAFYEACERRGGEQQFRQAIVLAIAQSLWGLVVTSAIVAGTLSLLLWRVNQLKNAHTAKGQQLENVFHYAPQPNWSFKRTPTLAMASPFSWPVLVPSALSGSGAA